QRKRPDDVLRPAHQAAQPHDLQRIARHNRLRQPADMHLVVRLTQTIVPGLASVYRSWSVSRRGGPPSSGTDHTPVLRQTAVRASSPSGEAVKHTTRPSGANRGWPADSPPAVRGRSCDPSGRHTQMSVRRSSPAVSWRAAAKVSNWPSGLQETPACSWSPPVTCTGSPSSTATVHTWVGRSNVKPTPSRRYRLRVIRR